MELARTWKSNANWIAMGSQGDSKGIAGEWQGGGQWDGNAVAMGMASGWKWKSEGMVAVAVVVLATVVVEVALALA